MMLLMFAIRWALLGSVSLFGQSSPVPVLDDSVKVIHFESLKYPIAARVTNIEGVVVVKAILDEQGGVSSVEPLSGPKQLLSDCAANASKWKFQPSSSKTVILVYDFRIVGLCSQDCGSQFIYRPPNLAVITAGAMVVDHR